MKSPQSSHLSSLWVFSLSNWVLLFTPHSESISHLDTTLLIYVSQPWHPTPSCAPPVVSTHSSVHLELALTQPDPHLDPLTLCPCLHVHDAMLLPSDSREHCWPITNTHDQMQITELAPKLTRVSATPRTHIHTHMLPPLPTISSCSSFVFILASLVPGLIFVP